MFLVLAKYKENIDWCNIIKNKIIYSKFKDEPNYVSEPTGEASSYLKYIIDNYNNLNEWTLFAHAHEKHWHHSTSLYKSLSIDTNILLKNNIKFLSINHRRWDLYSEQKLPKDTDYPKPMNYVEFNSKLGIKLHPQWLDNQTISDIFNLLFDKNVYIEYQFFPQSAQFIVHKDRILANSLDFYKRLYDWHLFHPYSLLPTTNKYQTKTGAFIFESYWHYIFGENLIFDIPEINDEKIMFYHQLPFKDYTILYKLNNIYKYKILNKIFLMFKSNYKNNKIFSISNILLN